MGKCIVPAVVVGKEEDGTIRPTDNKGVHVGEFGSMRDGNGLNMNFIGKCMSDP